MSDTIEFTTNETRWIPLPTASLRHTIMLFSSFSSNTSENLDEEYSNFVIPTVIENVSYARNSIYQTNNNGIAPLGNYTVIIDMQTSKFYRVVDGEKKAVEFLGPLEYGSKGFDEQAKKYFTIQAKTSSFIYGVYDGYNDGEKIDKKYIRNANFQKLGFRFHTITNIDIGGFGSRPDLLTLTGNAEV